MAKKSQTEKIPAATRAGTRKRPASTASQKNGSNTSTKRSKADSSSIRQPNKLQKAVSEKIHLTTEHKTSGTVLAVGSGDVGQLGLGQEVEEKKRFGAITSLPPIVDVAAGGMHTLCLSQNGEVYSFGCNDEGALGRQTSSLDGSEFTPGKVELPEKIVQVSAGDSHSAAVTKTGKVFIWGNFRDSKGPMGLNSSGRQLQPVQILKEHTVVQAASGSDHLACLTRDGRLFTCGCPEQGQLGRVAEIHFDRGGRKGLEFLLNPGEVKIKKPRGCKSAAFDKIWLGSYMTFARLKETGEIYAFGLNNYNQLGFPDDKNRNQPALVRSFSGKKWKKITTGQHHTILLDEEGKVYSLGRKEYGRLGLGENCEDQKAPALVPALQQQHCVDISAASSFSFAVDDQGQVYSWGMAGSSLGQGIDSEDDDVLKPAVVQGKALSSMFALLVSCGGQHSIVLGKEKDSVQNGSV